MRVKRFLLLHLPRVVLSLIFLAGAIDGFAFVFTGEHLLHPPTADRGLEVEVVLLVCVALLYRAYAPRYASLFAPGNP